MRFIINLPPEELESVERICFQVEEAQWFYEDFIRPLDPSLPSLSLRAFSLRIFQHCPLFSEWSADNYTAAFAEFLAYKSRVPVRGAIMLNDEMDQVVLVKGWKKGANWSFPRGKINKDEDDLDCAVREVYEETGFDIKAAGLVKEPQDMKYIEVTMREQHMRLYVFRGVPLDTYFEPRTRKEISKIEWYKLNDLPTLKKNKQLEGMGEHLANANKFYMVAPFLVPLKKWISQQRKRESRMSSQPYGMIPTVVEEPLTDYERDFANGLEQAANVPSDLPEVSESQPSPMDATLHLKQLLNIEKYPNDAKQLRAAMPPVDAAKSSALLALLRKGSRPDLPDISKPNTPFEQMSFPPDVPRSPHHRHPRHPQLSSLAPPPQFPISPSGARSEEGTTGAPSSVQAYGSMPVSPAFPPGMEPPAANAVHQRVAAPYQRTGDPEFSQPQFAPPKGPRVPPASALPPLTSHTRALLDVFKQVPPSQHPSPIPASSPTHKPLNTAAPPSISQESRTTIPVPVSADPSSVLPTLLANRAKAQNTQGSLKQARDHKASLLGLFKQIPSGVAEMAPNGSTPKLPLGPVELAASSTPSVQRDEEPNKQVLAKLLQQKSSTPAKAVSQAKSSPSQGRTAATISGPLNQPQFEGIAKTTRKASLVDPHARSPAPPNRTLYDPNQGMQKKILTRPVGLEQSSARSPRPHKSGHVASPKRLTSQKNDNAKSFQPQILRRPASDHKESSSQSMAQTMHQPSLEAIKAQAPGSSPSNVQAFPQQATPDNNKSPTENHKQTLLSLFSNPNSFPTMNIPRSIPSALPISGRTSTSSPAHESPSAIVSPLMEKPISSTRSRLGSLASMVSTGSGSGFQTRPVGEKRQTAPSDKAFLLGYLGRIASQES